VESKRRGLARFRPSSKAGHAEVHGHREAGWPALLEVLCADKGVGSLLFGAPGTGRGLAPSPRVAGATASPAWATARSKAWKADLFHDMDAAFTADPRRHRRDRHADPVARSADEPRLMSLVPPIHSCCSTAANIYNTFYEATWSSGWKDGLPTNALLISGPSKTADIQQTLAYGAHGPKELVVLLINGDEQ
jgi:L-lactate dehydrogenase complex protein LldG